MRGETKYVHGVPRTKGLRNSQAASAHAHKGGPHKNPRDKRRAQRTARTSARPTRAQVAPLRA